MLHDLHQPAIALNEFTPKISDDEVRVGLAHPRKANEAVRVWLPQMSGSEYASKVLPCRLLIASPAQGSPHRMHRAKLVAEPAICRDFDLSKQSRCWVALAAG